MHSFAGELVVLLLSRLLERYVSLCARNDPQAPLRAPAALTENPPLLRIGSLYIARYCLAYAHPLAYLPIKPPTLLLLWALLAAAA